jgi:hypothetical protein
VGIVCVLHVAAGSLSAYWDAADLTALSLDAPGNVSHWLASMLWSLGALMAMLTIRCVAIGSTTTTGDIAFVWTA